MSQGRDCLVAKQSLVVMRVSLANTNPTASAKNAKADLRVGFFISSFIFHSMSRLMKHRLFLFDLDDTLLDFRASEQLSFAKTMGRLAWTLGWREFLASTRRSMWIFGGSSRQVR